MQTEQKYHTTGLTLEWVSVVLVTLESKKIGADLYRSRTIKERLMDGMAWPNINALIKFLRSDPCSRGHIGGGLNLDGRTTERWEEKSHQPHPRNFFGLLYVELRREIADAELEYPNGARAVEDAVYSTLQIIRRRECERRDKAERSRRPRREDVLLVRQFMRHPRAALVAKAITGADGPAAEREIGRILKDLISYDRMEASSPAEESGRAKVARESIRNWAVAYALFRFGLPDEMNFILEAFDEEPS